MNKVLLLAAHPRMHRSRITAATLQAVQDIKGVVTRDLYELYPDFDIDVAREQQLLNDSDLLALLHPIYWYSAPAIIKEWIDRVLTRGYAYGEGGTALRDKQFIQLVSSGGSPGAYTPAGKHGQSLETLLQPFERTARFCGMRYLPAVMLQGSGAAGADARKHHVDTIAQLLRDYVQEGV